MSEFPILIPVVSLSDPDSLAKAIRFREAGARWIQVEDPEAEVYGAPQSVQSLMQIIRGAGTPIQYYGGVRQMHIAEMLLGLGVERLVVGAGLWKSQRSARFFAARLGEACICKIAGADLASRGSVLAAEGATRFQVSGLSGAKVEAWDCLGTDAQVQLDSDRSERNLVLPKTVILEAHLFRGGDDEVYPARTQVPASE